MPFLKKVKFNRFFSFKWFLYRIHCFKVKKKYKKKKLFFNFFSSFNKYIIKHKNKKKGLNKKKILSIFHKIKRSKSIKRIKRKCKKKIYRKRLNRVYLRKKFSFYMHKSNNLFFKKSFFYSIDYFFSLVFSVQSLIFDHFRSFSVNTNLIFTFLRFFFLYFLLLKSYFSLRHSKLDSFFFSHLSFFSLLFKNSVFLFINFSIGNVYLNNFSFFYFSKFSSLFFFRHSFFSLYFFGVSFYHIHQLFFSSNSNSLFFYFNNLKRSRSVLVKPFITFFLRNCFFISFLFKFFYLSFLRSFLIRFGISNFFSDTFFFSLLRFFSDIKQISFFSSLFSLRRLRSSFFSFLIGTGDVFYNRLFFFFFQFSTQIPIFFFFWLLNRYYSLCLHIYFRNLKFDFFFFFILCFNNQNFFFLSNNIFFLFIRFSNLFSIFTSISNIFFSMRFSSFSVDSFFFSEYRRNFVSSTISFLFSSFLFQVKSFRRNYQFFFNRKAIFNLTYQLENSLFKYSNVPYFFFARFYNNSFLPPITNAKMVCEFVIVQLSLGFRINSVFSKVLNWQKYWKRKTDSKSNTFLNLYRLNLGIFSYPLKGIRIICSGPPYKARRTHSSKYHLWVSNEFFTGRMPLSTMDLHIDYYQSFVVLRRSNIGVKVWLLFDEVL